MRKSRDYFRSYAFYFGAPFIQRRCVPESFEKLTSVNKKVRILTVPLAGSFEIIYRNSVRPTPRTARQRICARARSPRTLRRSTGVTTTIRVGNLKNNFSVPKAEKRI